MKQYTATLNTVVETVINFESLYTKEYSHSTPWIMEPGPRRFSTARAARSWVAVMNTYYGEGTATYNGKL